MCTQAVSQRPHTPFLPQEVSDIDAAFGNNKLYLGGDVGSETLIIHPYEGLDNSHEVGTVCLLIANESKVDQSG